MGWLILIVLLLIVLILLLSCVKIVPQATAMVVERLGGYRATWSVGLHVKAPFIDRVAKKVILKEQVVDFAPQPVITKDNVTMRIDTVVFFQITDPKLFAYGVENPIMAIENLTATTLRNIIGDLELDQTLTSRETINTKMRASLDIATDPWGIKVNRVSGGEKAFVAIALYFAILKLRPTPFCVLDEIEAALDDVNVQRFAKYIRRLTDSTQFIVITHRRGTMEEADMLYGVTMQEQGVSKMLMLNLAEAEKRLKNTIK